jgi:hypothetical protein
MHSSHLFQPQSCRPALTKLCTLLTDTLEKSEYTDSCVNYIYLPIFSIQSRLLLDVGLAWPIPRHLCVYTVFRKSLPFGYNQWLKTLHFVSYFLLHFIK